MQVKSLVIAALTVAAQAADPANGWISYVVGTPPAGTERVTRLEMTWAVSSNPRRSSAFFSPWFGMDPSDNLNLIQPVNPWGGGQWSAYTEYFQWKPEHNSNSDQISVKAGQKLHGILEYNSTTDSYDCTQTNTATGVKSYQNVKCQSGKKYVLPYVVYEKVFPCGDYPPDGAVTFTDIIAECDGKDCAAAMTWKPVVFEDHCDFRGHVASGNSEISLTWNTKMESKYDNFTRAELFDLNGGANINTWAGKLGLERPAN